MRVPSEDVCLRSLLFQESTRRFIVRTICQYSASRGHRLRPEEVEDVAQETLLRLWRVAAKVSPVRLGSYLRQSARNAVIDQLRHEHAAKRGHGARDRPSDLERIEADDRSVEEILQGKADLDERLNGLRRVLSPRDVKVLRLVFGAGLTSSEAAARLHVSASSIDSIVFRARARLAACRGLVLRTRRNRSSE